MSTPLGPPDQEFSPPNHQQQPTTATTRPPQRWDTVRRNVQPTIERIIGAPGSIVLIRGHRGVGKATAVKEACFAKRKEVVFISIVSEHAQLLQDLQQKLGPVTHLMDSGRAIAETVKSGKCVALEEIQNSSNTFQVALQQGIDDLLYWSAKATDAELAQGGVLFLMGSLPSLVDSLVDSRSAPLYQRVTSKTTVLPFDTQEMMRVYQAKDLWFEGCGHTLLLLHTVFGGNPHLLQIAAKAGLLCRDVSTAEVINEIFTSEFRQESEMVKGFFERQLGKRLGDALKCATQQKTKQKQIEVVSQKCGVDVDEAFQLLSSELCDRYGILAPVYDLNNEKQIHSFVPQHQSLILALAVDKYCTCKIQDVVRAIDKLDINTEEGLHFECWIREILHDRKLLLNKGCLPNFEPAPVYIAPRLNWSMEECEIDILASVPLQRILIVGSCKHKASDKNLRANWQKLLEGWSKIKKSLVFWLKLPDDLPKNSEWKIRFVHFSSDKWPSSNETNCGSEVDASLYISLEDLLADFVE